MLLVKVMTNSKAESIDKTIDTMNSPIDLIIKKKRNRIKNEAVVLKLKCGWDIFAPDKQH